MPILYGMQVELWTLHIWWYCQVIHHRMLEHHPSFIGKMLTNALKTSNVFRACCVKKETHSASFCWKEIWLQVKLLQVGNSPKTNISPTKCLFENHFPFFCWNVLFSGSTFGHFFLGGCSSVHPVTSFHHQLGTKTAFYLSCNRSTSRFWCSYVPWKLSKKVGVYTPEN